MPQIPDGRNRPNINETIIDLLESIALEEMAISHILNAEGEKLQAVIKKYLCREINLYDLDSVSNDINRMLIDLIIKEWLLIVKFNHINDFTKNMGDYNFFSSDEKMPEKKNKKTHISKNESCDDHKPPNKCNKCEHYRCDIEDIY